MEIWKYNKFELSKCSRDCPTAFDVISGNESEYSQVT